MKRLFLIALLFVPQLSFAEDLEGVVQVVGARINVKVMLTKPKEDKGPHLCAGDIAKKVRKIPAMMVKVQGVWQDGKKIEDRCFKADSFVVTKATSGRKAYVGVFEKSEAKFLLKTPDKTAVELVEVPEGLKKLVGKNVILDLKELDIPTAKEPVQRVVFYAEHP